MTFIDSIALSIVDQACLSDTELPGSLFTHMSTSYGHVETSGELICKGQKS
jgi:hypothetical protein